MAKKAGKPAAPILNFAKMAPYGKQREIIEHSARFKVVAFGRQSGKSWLAKRVLLEEAANNGKNCWWVAPALSAAADHWMDLLNLIESSGIPTASINRSSKTITFLSGGVIRIRSADVPNNLRGGTLDFLVLDEAAFMVEDVWYKILQPTITASRGKVLFLSTPNGHNWFYLLFKLGQNEEFPDFASWHMPSTEAPYQDHEMLEVIRKTVPVMVWREEYMAEFLADSGGVFAGLDRLVPRPMLLKPEKGHVYVAGLDWGMDEDYSVFTVFDKYERKQVFGDRFNSIGTLEQVQRIIDHLVTWQPEICLIETNGIGTPMFKLLKETLARATPNQSEDYFSLNGRTRLRGVNMTNARKRMLIERYSSAIEWGRFDPLTRDNEADTLSFGAIQISEMSTFQRKRTQSGLEITYSAAEGYHDDTVTAGALAYHGMDDIGLEDDEKIHATAEPVRTRRTSKRSPFQTRSTRPQERGQSSRKRGKRSA